MAHSIRKLSEIDAAYVAGVVDGEGTISLVCHHGGENRRVVVSVANTELPLLAYLKSIIGAGRITNKRIAKLHHTPSFTYVIYSRQALALLQRITPYLRTHKRERADLLLRDYLALTPRNGRYTPTLLMARRSFEDRIFAIRVRSAMTRREPSRGSEHCLDDEHAGPSTGNS